MTKVEAREQALGALYAADVQGTGSVDTTGLDARSRRLADGVWEHREEIDATIGGFASGWRVERMPAVDRNVLRLGVYELRYTDTPVGVVLDEAVELAKRFSTGRSGRFVNGVLAAVVASDREPHGD